MLEKRSELLAALDRGIAMIHLDARHPGVDVPAAFKNEPHLRLNLSYRYRLPTLDIGEDQIVADLSFGSQSYRCIIPWHPLFAISTPSDPNSGTMWIEYAPAEVLLKTTPVVDAPPVDEPKKRVRPTWLQVIDGGLDDSK